MKKGISDCELCIASQIGHNFIQFLNNNWFQREKHTNEQRFFCNGLTFTFPTIPKEKGESMLVENSSSNVTTNHAEKT